MDKPREYGEPSPTQTQRAFRLAAGQDVSQFQPGKSVRIEWIEGRGGADLALSSLNEHAFEGTALSGIALGRFHPGINEGIVTISFSGG